MAAIRAAQLGLKTAIVERDALGGVCLNWGCIPSKALLRNAEVLGLVRHADDFGISFDNLTYDFGVAVDRSRRVVKRLTTGIAALLREKSGRAHRGDRCLQGLVHAPDRRRRHPLSEQCHHSDRGRDRTIPSLPVDRETVITSRESTELRDCPKRVVIVGGGATGVEFAYIYRTYGAEVTVVELLPRLVPLEDEDVSRQLERPSRSRASE